MVYTNPDPEDTIKLTFLDGETEVVKVIKVKKKNNKQENKRRNIFYNLIHKNKVAKVTLLSREEVGFSFDCKTDPIEAIAKYGTKCAVTDFAIVTGCCPSDETYVKDKKSLKERTGIWWLSDSSCYCMYFDGCKLEAWNEHSRYAIGLRPVIREMGTVIDAEEVIYGEYPQYAASLDLQQILNRLFKEGKLKKTNRKYTINQRNIYDSYKHFKPLVLDEYIYEGKKYVRVISKMPEELSNGKRCKYGDEVWIEVSPIHWLVDQKENLLISENILIGGMSLEKLNKSIKYKNESDMFLNKYFINEINANTIKEKDDLEEDELLSILNKIKKYQKYYTGSLDIESKINALIEDYNNKLEELTKEDSKNIELSIDQKRPRTPEGLHEELINNLNNILDEVKTYSIKVKDYYKMIDILNDCKSIKLDIDEDENEKDFDKDEIFKEIKYIKVTIIKKFLTDARIKKALLKELNSIIDRNINRIINYIEEFKNQNDIETKSIEELKLEFRKDFVPFLNKIRVLVEKQDLVNEVKRSTKLMIDNLYVETKNERLKFMFNEINKLKDYINNLGTDEQKKRLIQLLDVKIDLNDDLKTILDNLENLYKTICNLSIEIENMLYTRQKIDRFKVKVNIPEFFNPSGKKTKSR